MWFRFIKNKLEQRGMLPMFYVFIGMLIGGVFAIIMVHILSPVIDSVKTTSEYNKILNKYNGKL